MPLRLLQTWDLRIKAASVILLASAAAPLAGCSSDSVIYVRHDDGGAPPQTVELVPQSSVETDKVDPLPKVAGMYFVVVDLKIRNHGTTSIPLIPTLFSVVAAGGVEYLGDPLTVTATGGCPANAAVTPQGQIECTLVFRVPLAAVTNQIHYTVPMGPDGGMTLYTAPLTTIPCGLCSDGCHDFSSDPKNCGGCGKLATNGTCMGGTPTCMPPNTFCADACVDLTSDAANCGTCGAQVPSGQQCINGAPGCATGFLVCDGSCTKPDPNSLCCAASCAGKGKKCDPGSTANWSHSTTCITQTVHEACDVTIDTHPPAGCVSTDLQGWSCACS